MIVFLVGFLFGVLFVYFVSAMVLVSIFYLDLHSEIRQDQARRKGLS